MCDKKHYAKCIKCHNFVYGESQIDLLFGYTLVEDDTIHPNTSCKACVINAILLRKKIS